MLKVGDKVIVKIKNAWGSNFTKAKIDKVNKTTYKVNGQLYYINTLRTRTKSDVWHTGINKIVPYTDEEWEKCKRKLEIQTKERVRPVLKELLSQYEYEIILETLKEFKV